MISKDDLKQAKIQLNKITTSSLPTKEKTERNFDFLMNEYTKSIEQRFLTRLKNC